MAAPARALPAPELSWAGASVASDVARVLRIFRVRLHFGEFRLNLLFAHRLCGLRWNVLVHRQRLLRQILVSFLDQIVCICFSVTVLLVHCLLWRRRFRFLIWGSIFVACTQVKLGRHTEARITDRALVSA